MKPPAPPTPVARNTWWQTPIRVPRWGWLLLAALGVWMLPRACRSLACDESEQARVVSPDGALSAQVEVLDCGATTSLVYSVHLSDGSLQLLDDGEVFVASHVDRLTVSWLGPRQLRISYRAAQIASFRSRWSVRGRAGEWLEVKVSERERP